MGFKFVGYKIKLYPTKDQIHMFNEYFGLSRFVYNLALEIRDNQYQSYLRGESDTKYSSYITINNEIRKLRKTNPKYEWMNKYNSETICACIRDLLNGYMRFARGQAKNKPRFKSKKDLGSKSFPTRSDRLVVSENGIRISSIGWVNAKRVPKNICGSGYKKCKNTDYLNYINARVSYDGIYYWISFEIKTDFDDTNIAYNSNYNYMYNTEYVNASKSKAIGIDLGCNKYNWIVMSDGYIQKLPDFTKEKKKISMLFRKAARQRRINIKRSKRTNSTIDTRYKPSNNEFKTNRKINKYYKKMVHKRTNSIYEACKHILDIKPEAVVMETLKSTNMLKNNVGFSINKLNEMVYDSAFHLIKTKFSYVLPSNGIPVVFAPDDYPSTQLCHCCGNRYHIGKKRIYKCPVCGINIDRDINAAKNLSNWYYDSYNC